MSALPDAPIPPVRSEWLKPGLLTVAALLLLTALFWPTFYSMAAVWERSETFAHGYLIFPISLWLIWRNWASLSQIQPSPDVRGLVLLGLAGLGWLLADAGSVNVAAQYAYIVMLIAMVWTLLGIAFLKAALFPLTFLLFAVPMGEFLIQPLMGVTADFTVAMLQFTGIPVYREGMFFSIPSGDWSVVEGCSGLRYLIASITLGVLYAYLTYRSWKRRLLFSIAAIVVPIFANSGRAYMIVMIAHFSDMKLALGVDHYIYGWVFFGIVMLLLFWIGSFWREDDLPAPPVVDAPAASSPRPARALLPVMVLALGVAGLWPVYAQWLSTRPLPVMPDLQLDTQARWQPADTFTSWVPHWVGADKQMRQAYRQDGLQVLLALDYYATQRQDAELINSQNYMIKQKHPDWSNVGEAIVTVKINGEPRQVRQAKLRARDGQRLLVWQWNLINQRPLVNDHLAKLSLAFDRVRMKRDDGLSVIIATPYEDMQTAPAAATLSRFAADMEGAIGGALDRVDGQ